MSSVAIKASVLLGVTHARLGEEMQMDRLAEKVQKMQERMEMGETQHMCASGPDDQAPDFEGNMQYDSHFTWFRYPPFPLDDADFKEVTNPIVLEWLQQSRDMNLDVAPKIGEIGKGGAFIIVDVLHKNNTVTGMANICEYTRLFHHLAMRAHRTGPFYHIIRVSVPLQFILEMMRNIVLPATDEIDDPNTDWDESAEHEQYPMLVWARNGRNDALKVRGRLTYTYGVRGWAIAEPCHDPSMMKFMQNRAEAYTDDCCEGTCAR